jgi:hypothetical protein
MNVREAILRAADHIERQPEDYDFGVATVPTLPGAKGCALGWIGHYMGLEGYSYTEPLFKGLGPIRGPDAFYHEMSQIEGGIDACWTRNPLTCARVLRLYADSYHPAPRPTFAKSIVAEIAKLPFHEDDDEDETEDEEVPAVTLVDTDLRRVTTA